MKKPIKVQTHLASIFFDLVPESGPDGTSIPKDGLQHDLVGTLDLLAAVKALLDTPLQQTPKVLRNIDVPSQTMLADVLVHLDTTAKSSAGSNSQKAKRLHTGGKEPWKLLKTS